MPVYNNELFTLQLFLFFNKNEIFKFLKKIWLEKLDTNKKCVKYQFFREKNGYYKNEASQLLNLKFGLHFCYN